MAAKQTFTDDQIDILIGVIRRAQKRFKNQVELAKAIDITQPSLSSMLSGKWRPGLSTARHIASLERMDLEELLPDFRASSSSSSKLPPSSTEDRPNLEKCLVWHEDEARWNPWTIAAARAGYFGSGDFAKGEWVMKLDNLEKLLARGRKA